MSRMKSEEEYRKTKAFHFFRWLSGEKDPYIGNLEMRPQKEYMRAEDSIRDRMRESQMVMDKVYDTRHNRWLLLFRRFYRIMAVIFCIMLAGLLLFTVSYLPPTGNASNPDNNEVASRYIESGMQETGADDTYLPGIRYFWRDKCTFYRYLLCDDYADGGRRGVKEAGGDERSAF